MPKRRSRQRHFGIIDPGYARVFTQARIVAWQYGYACVMHGSFTRDLDLLLVPWEEHARGNNDQLLRLIASACDLAVPVDASRAIQWTRKPHGRVACSLSFMGFADRRWVDISIAPCVPKHQDGEAEYASWFRQTPAGVAPSQASSEPVAWQWRRLPGDWTTDYTFPYEVHATTPDSEVRPLYAGPVTRGVMGEDGKTKS